MPSETETVRSASKREVLLTQDVLVSMDTYGMVEVEAPNEFTPQYDGYREVKHFENQDNLEMYVVYIFENSSGGGFGGATEDCGKKWDNGDCSGSGTTCDVEVNDGVTTIICCDDDDDDPPVA